MQVKLRHFSDLIVWQLAHQLALEVYRKTESFPKAEVYGMTSQMRRSAVSVGSNIAEGFGRQGTKEKIQFYCIARGSILELESQLLLSKDLGWINTSDQTILIKKLVDTHKTLNALISSLR